MVGRVAMAAAASPSDKDGDAQVRDGGSKGTRKDLHLMGQLCTGGVALRLGNVQKIKHGLEHFLFIILAYF